MSETLAGKCMCGAVALNAEVSKPEMGVCHCSMCRKWAGGISMLVECDSFKIEDETHVGIFASSDWGERGFCNKCGSTLFWRMQDGTHQNVSAMLFDDPGAFKLTSEIYIDHKPENYSFEQETNKLTEAEVIALFTGGEESQNG